MTIMLGLSFLVATVAVGFAQEKKAEPTMKKKGGKKGGKKKEVTQKKGSL